MNLLPPEGELVALDTETNGLDFTLPDFRVHIIGLASKHGIYVLNFDSVSATDKELLKQRLLTYKLVSHNVAFDMGAMAAAFDGTLFDWQYCTYGLYRQIASEGFPGQRWGLKYCMTELLGWPEVNNLEVGEWLKQHGHVKGPKKNPNFEMMHLVPFELMAPYCGLDAEACLQLLFLFKIQVLNRPEFANLARYHSNFFIPNVEMYIEQRFRGITIDVEKLQLYKETLTIKKDLIQLRFMEHKDVAGYISEFSTKAYTAWLTKFPKSKVALDSPKFKFNINSKKQLQWLFYERVYRYKVLKEPVPQSPDKRELDKDKIGLVELYLPDLTLQVRMTPSGEIPIDKKILPLLGECGKLVSEYNRILKELGYVESCLESVRDGKLHAGIRMPGTLTGRIAAGGE